MEFIHRNYAHASLHENLWRTHYLLCCGPGDKVQLDFSWLAVGFLNIKVKWVIRSHALPCPSHLSGMFGSAPAWGWALCSEGLVFPRQLRIPEAGHQFGSSGARVQLGMTGTWRLGSEEAELWLKWEEECGCVWNLPGDTSDFRVEAVAGPWRLRWVLERGSGFFPLCSSLPSPSFSSSLLYLNCCSVALSHLLHRLCLSVARVPAASRPSGLVFSTPF